MVKQFDWPELMLPIKAMRKTPSLSKFEQVNWPELMLPIKLFQFKYVN